MDRQFDSDMEKHAVAEDEVLGSGTYTSPAPGSYEEEVDNSLFARMNRVGTKLGVEVRGIERVPDEERTDNSYWNIGSMVFEPLILPASAWMPLFPFLLNPL